MSNFEITKPELSWPGKYDEQGNHIINRGLALPFQAVETIREGRATREPGRVSDLFAFARPQTEIEWKNKLIWGENMLVMASLMEQFAGKVDLIYIDPPFATGSDFSFRIPIGDHEIEVQKEASLIEEKAYRDTWGEGVASYLRMMSDRLSLMSELLAPTGSIVVHCDWHMNYMLRSVLDEVFGSQNFVNEIIWYYYNKFQGNVNHFAANHDTLLWYRKGDQFKFTPQKEKRDSAVKQIKRAWDKDTGRIVNVKGADGKVIYQETDERTVDDVWRISMLQPADKTQNTGYPTQKPEALAERLIKAITDEGALVADFFCGSGTVCVTAEKLGRRWIGNDLGRFAVHTTRKRLLEVSDCRPFEILNLGKYERKYWQGTSFGNQQPIEPDKAAIVAYIRFVLELYRAQPLSGTHIHGRKGPALVHVGAVDSPVTISEINDAVAECVALKQKELHILGWEWEMGLHDPLSQNLLKEHGVKLRLLNIPREVMEKNAVEAGEVRFFDLAHLEAEIIPDGKNKRRIKVALKDFVIPDTDLIPDDVRAKIKKWSDYIDYWAVDWDNKGDAFHNEWQSYRTRKSKDLQKDISHKYEAAGEYNIVVKVIDILGNDTTKTLRVKVG